jgi:hypothetical protein
MDADILILLPTPICGDVSLNHSRYGSSAFGADRHSSREALQPSRTFPKATWMENIRIAVDASIGVSGLLLAPPDSETCFVLAHGAGAGMRHRFMETMATGLSQRRIATLRYQFPYMEKGSRRPDSPALAHATVRAAVAEARVRCPDIKLVAGGKSYGGRMTSQAQALSPLGVCGLVFLLSPPSGGQTFARSSEAALRCPSSDAVRSGDAGRFGGFLSDEKHDRGTRRHSLAAEGRPS